MTSTSRAVNMLATTVVLVSLAAAALVLRFTARQRRHLPYKKDDWLSLAGQILLFAMLIEIILWVVLGGAGKHWSLTTAQEKVEFFRIWFASQITFIILTPVIKLSVLSFYQRIFDVYRFRLVTNVLMAIITIFFLAHLVFGLAFSCRPIRKAWDPTAPGDCRPALPPIIIFQAGSVAFDVIILALPIRMCWKLHLPWQDRAAISGVFLVGAFVCAASVARLDAVLKLDRADFSFSIYDACMWSLVEPCIGQVCACLPVARGLLPAWSSGRPGTSHGSTASVGGGKHRHESVGATVKHMFAHHHEDESSTDQNPPRKWDDKPLVSDAAESKDKPMTFELQRSNSHLSKTSAQVAAVELEIV